MRRMIHVILALFALSQSSFGQLTIAEVSPHQGIEAINGESCDWIELRNDGNAAIELDAYSINDAFDAASAWQLPERVLFPGERIVLLASGNGRNYLPEGWSCPVLDSDQWSYIVPTSNLSDTWKLPGFNDAGWNQGPGGFGYGDGDDATILSEADFVFIRKSFEIESIEELGYVSLAMDYDDGFIAYLNGHEVARSNSMIGLEGNVGDFANEYVEAVLYAGGQPEQWLWDPTDYAGWLQTGENVLAVQVHNFNANSSDLSIRPFLGLTFHEETQSAGPNPPEWWPQFQGYYHVPFQISPGESITLADDAGNVIDALPIHPELPQGYTVGRVEGSTEDWCIFDTPTPGESNAGSTCLTNIEPNPVVTFPSGWYSGVIFINLSANSSDQVVRYTLNGDVPDENSEVFPATGLMIDQTTSLSMKAWGASGETLPSDVVDEIYIMDEFTPDLPTFSIVTDEDHLWDWNTGIYVMGPNASAEYPHFGANFWEPWSKPARLQFFDANQIVQAREKLDLEIHGGWSRAEPQRSFRLDFKNELSGDFDWPVFAPVNPIASFNNLNLRNGGQQSWATKFQDGLISTLANETHNLASAWQPAHLYLNGEYWGLYAAREKTDEHFIADHFGTDQAEVDLVGPFAVLNGSDATLIAASNVLMSTPANSAGFYSLFAEHFDIENYIDYFVFETYTQNTDWIGIAWGLNNVKAFRAGPDHPWRYLLYDTDASFGFFGAGVWQNFIESARNPGFPNLHSNLFDRVLDNDTFRHQFVNRYADLVNTMFQTSSFNPRVAAAKTLIEDAMNYHIDRWNSPATTTAWLNAINNMTTHNANRIQSARSHLMDSFGLPEAHECTIEVFPPLAGKVRVNTIVPGPLPWDGIYFEGCPIELQAIAEPGWMFDQWDANAHVATGDLAQFESLDVVALHSDDLYRARFEPCPEDAAASIVVTSSSLSVTTENVPFIDSIAWSLNGITVGTGANWIPATAGNYSATVLFDGCSVHTEEVYTGSMDVGHVHTTTPFMTLAPNPASTAVEVRWNGNQDLTVRDATGRLIREVRASSVQAQSISILDVSKWPEGMYFMHSGPFSNKLVIQR